MRDNRTVTLNDALAKEAQRDKAMTDEQGEAVQDVEAVVAEFHLAAFVKLPVLAAGGSQLKFAQSAPTACSHKNSAMW